MDWNSSILWGVIGLVGGAIVSLLFYFCGKIRKILVYNISTTTIVSNSISSIKGLNIKYNKNKISDFNTSTITIKNNGNSIIETNDLLSPLCLTTDGKFFINSIKVTTENNTNNVYVIFDHIENNASQKAIIKFDYLPINEIISFTVFHTGHVSLSGVFKSGKFKYGTIKKAEKESKQSLVNISFILGIFFQIIINIISNFLSSYLIK